MTTTVSPELNPVRWPRRTTIAVAVVALFVGLAVGALLADNSQSPSANNPASAAAEVRETPATIDANVEVYRQMSPDTAYRRIEELARRQDACRNGMSSVDSAFRCLLLLEPSRG